MKYRSLAKWDDLDACKSLIYFVQLAEEMLFDFSLDTYKASVMHAGLICGEAKDTIKDIRKGIIKEPNLKHVIDELCNCLEKDDVAKALTPIPIDSFFSVLKNPKPSISEKKTAIEVLSVSLNPSNYKSKNEELLYLAIKRLDPYQSIRRLARTYITTLVGIGYNETYIKDKLISFFYYGSNRIGNVESIQDFFLLFPEQTSEFNVIFRASKSFEDIGSSVAHLNILITRTLPQGIDLRSQPGFWVRDNETFAIVGPVTSRDPFGARDHAEHLLKISSTLINMYYHKKIPSWNSECVVQNINASTYRKLSSPINSMHKCSDLLPKVANKRLNDFLFSFSLEHESYAKFIRSAQLHSLALNSNSSENQILNLWISLESLIPSETKDDNLSNIEHIISSVIPFLNLGYVESLINNLFKDLARWNRRTTTNALKHIPGKKFTHRLARALALCEHSNSLQLIEDGLQNFHLLRDRLNFFKEILSNPAKVVSMLDAHQQRLQWQIRRIYRARNIIVHNGRTPRHTKQLIENLHNYMDVILNTLVTLGSEPKKVTSVSQGFQLTMLKYNRYYSGLTVKNLAFTADNIDKLLFVSLRMEG